MAARTYRLSEQTIKGLQSLVNETDVAPSPLVDALLWLALEEVKTGRWVVGRRPDRWALTGIERSVQGELAQRNGRQANDR